MLLLYKSVGFIIVYTFKMIYNYGVNLLFCLTSKFLELAKEISPQEQGSSVVIQKKIV